MRWEIGYWMHSSIKASTQVENERQIKSSFTCSVVHIDSFIELIRQPQIFLLRMAERLATIIGNNTPNHIATSNLQLVLWRSRVDSNCKDFQN